MIHADDAPSLTPRPSKQFGLPLSGKPPVLAQLPDVSTRPPGLPGRQTRVDPAHDYGRSRPTDHVRQPDTGGPEFGLGDLEDPALPESSSWFTEPSEAAQAGLGRILREDAAHHVSRSTDAPIPHPTAEPTRPAEQPPFTSESSRAVRNEPAHIAKRPSPTETGPTSTKTGTFELPSDGLAAAETNWVDFTVKTLAVVLAVILLLMAWRNLQQRPLGDEVDRTLPAANEFEDAFDVRVARRSEPVSDPPSPADPATMGRGAIDELNRPVFIDTETGTPQDQAATVADTTYPSTGYPKLVERSDELPPPNDRDAGPTPFREIPWPSTSKPSVASEPTPADPRDRPQQRVPADSASAMETAVGQGPRLRPPPRRFPCLLRIWSLPQRRLGWMEPSKNSRDNHGCHRQRLYSYLR